MIKELETITQILGTTLIRHPELHVAIDMWIKNYSLEQKKLGKYVGLNDLDRKLENFLNYDNGYFVELGANDGINQSNTFYFETHRAWKGILVEPVLHNYFKCLSNRSKQTNIFCNACVSFEYKDPFVPILYSNLMSVPLGVATDILDARSHAEIGQQFLENGEHPVEFGARAISLHVLLEKSKAPRQIDLLSLDVEGGEREVLAGIDHSIFRFKYICIESRDKVKLDEFLSSKNYIFIDQLSDHDYLYTDNLRKK